MHHELILYVLVAVLICFMLVLCVDVIRRNNKNNRSNLIEKEPGYNVHAPLSDQKTTPVYPLYVDCSYDLIKNRITSETSAQDSETIISGQQSA